MSIVSWIIVGLIAGWLAGTIMKGRGYGILHDIVVGILGAMVGGFLAAVLLGGDYVTGVNLGTILVSVVGAILADAGASVPLSLTEDNLSVGAGRKSGRGSRAFAMNLACSRVSEPMADAKRVVPNLCAPLDRVEHKTDRLDLALCNVEVSK